MVFSEYISRLGVLLLVFLLLLSNGVLQCEHGLDFLDQLMGESIKFSQEYEPHKQENVVSQIPWRQLYAQAQTFSPQTGLNHKEIRQPAAIPVTLVPLELPKTFLCATSRRREDTLSSTEKNTKRTTYLLISTVVINSKQGQPLPKNHTQNRGYLGVDKNDSSHVLSEDLG